MAMMQPQADLEVGYNVPATIGMAEADVQTPCLVVDLNAFERNLSTMREAAKRHGVALRAHGKMHRSSAVALRQMEIGGAVGVCCQKVSEAEAFIRGGVGDVLVSNEVTALPKIDRLARISKLAKVGVCVDDLANVDTLSEAVTRHGGALDVLIEIDVGAGRCGIAPGAAAVDLAQQIIAAPGLTFRGLQAYNGSAQHIVDFTERRARVAQVVADTRATVDALADVGITCETVTGAGTGTYAFEAGSGLFTEIQCGSYAFMDRGYRAVRDEGGGHMPAFEHALFVATTVMSHAKADVAVCDAGHKSTSIDDGMPTVFGRNDLRYEKCSDEHGVIADPEGALRINDRLRLVPGHCDPTCNLHDWLVGIRDGKVEALWAVDARGKGY